ncbi:MAG: large conductance mechanosensitive channel protein MscL [Clostridia bacterium]|nr:large conductance mechanosensitive channel protein MscL [Clostridia bacterium]MBQ3639973.1 large conductance mechanosensitive channel protein MscL [Clostridia bacterium]
MAKKKSTFWSDFKAFLSRGNILDMAVGVIIGGAFGKIVTGLVNFILNPIIGYFVKTGSLDDVKTVLRPAEIEIAADGTEKIITAESAILWGSWVQTIIDFIITAFCIFLIIRAIAKAKAIAEREKIATAEKKAAEDKAAAEAKAAEEAEKKAAFENSIKQQEVLLAEIRDILAKK